MIGDIGNRTGESIRGARMVGDMSNDAQNGLMLGVSAPEKKRRSPPASAQILYSDFVKLLRSLF